MHSASATVDQRRSDPKIEPMLMGASAAAKLCGISLASWYRHLSAGKTPRPIRLGGRVLWRVSDLRRWIDLGCPEREIYDSMK